MRMEDLITPIHLDVLREIGNIGAGHAATSLSILINKKIDMNVPSAKMVTFNEMIDMMGGAEAVAAGVFLRIEGDAPGSMFFLLPIEQALAFVRNMLSNPEASFEDSQDAELTWSAMQELGNILTGSYLTSLGDFTRLNLQPSVPALSIDMTGAIISYGLLEVSKVSDYAIIIDTEIIDVETKNREKYKGHFLLLLDPESFEKIFRSLGVE
jgi:chemotaxis protein CheC